MAVNGILSRCFRPRDRNLAGNDSANECYKRIAINNLCAIAGRDLNCEIPSFLFLQLVHCPFYDLAFSIHPIHHTQNPEGPQDEQFMGPWLTSSLTLLAYRPKLCSPQGRAVLAQGEHSRRNGG